MRSRKAAVAFIFVTVLLDMLALGIVLPVLPKLVERFLNGDTARAATIYGVFGSAWALMQFISMPLLGALSDRYGRRPVILFSCVGLACDQVLMALAPNLTWLFVGRLISGVSAANISTAYAYIADVTAQHDRARAFGLIGTAAGMGLVLGPALGGALGAVGPQVPFWLAAALSAANALYGWFVLPESLPPERRQEFAWSKANPIAALKLLKSHRQLLGLATTDFLFQLARIVLPSTAVLYIGHRYGWGETAAGLVLASIGASALIVQGGLVGPVVKRFRERRALLAGLAFGAAGMLVFGLAPSGLVFAAGIPLLALWGFIEPSAQALMTNRVNESEQGRLQGAASCVQAVAGMIGPAIFTQAFAFFIAADRSVELPGAPFVMAALLLAGGVAVAWRTTHGKRSTQSKKLY